MSISLCAIFLQNSRKVCHRLIRKKMKNCRAFSVNNLSRQNAPDIVPIGLHPTKEFDIPVPWGRIAARQSGSMDGKPVLGLHGLLDNAASFDRLIPLLPYDWNLITIDLLGHGKSSHLPTGPVYYFHEHLATLVRITKHLSWQKFNIIGHGLGATLGLMFAGIFPEKIHHLVCLDLVKPFTRSSDDPEFWKICSKSYEQILKMELGPKTRHVYRTEEAIKKILKKRPGSLTQESAKILARRGTRQLLHGVVFTRDKRLTLPISTTYLFSTDQYFALIPQMKCKLLIIIPNSGNTTEMQEDNTKCIELYKNHCSTFQYIEVEGTYHVHLNNPEYVANHIIKFVHKDRFRAA